MAIISTSASCPKRQRTSWDMLRCFWTWWTPLGTTLERSSCITRSLSCTSRWDDILEDTNPCRSLPKGRCATHIRFVQFANFHWETSSCSLCWRSCAKKQNGERLENMAFGHPCAAGVPGDNAMLMVEAADVFFKNLTRISPIYVASFYTAAEVVQMDLGAPYKQVHWYSRHPCSRLWHWSFRLVRVRWGLLTCCFRRSCILSITTWLRRENSAGRWCCISEAPNCVQKCLVPGIKESKAVRDAISSSGKGCKLCPKRSSGDRKLGGNKVGVWRGEGAKDYPLFV